MPSSATPAFVNRTTRVELEQRVTHAVADEFVSHGRLKLVRTPGEADAILKGSIDSFGIFPVAFNTEGRATQYQISITANIELLDHRNEDRVLSEQESRAIQDIAVMRRSTEA
jgi:hypothetical protein